MVEVEYIDGGERKDRPGYNAERDLGRMTATDKNNSYATEANLKANYDRKTRENPGLRSSVAGEYRKY